MIESINESQIIKKPLKNEGQKNRQEVQDAARNWRLTGAFNYRCNLMQTGVEMLGDEVKKENELGVPDAFG
jgi:hypothetical protein